MLPMMSIEQGARLARGVQRLPVENGEERFMVSEGTRMFFSRKHADGRVEVLADVYSPTYQAPEAMGPQPQTFAPFGL